MMTFLSDQKNCLSSPNIGDTMQVTKYAWFPTWVSKPDSLVWLKNYWAIQEFCYTDQFFADGNRIKRWITIQKLKL